MRWALAFISLICFAKGNAQLPAGIKFTNYTRELGLPEENVNSIVQDSRGFLWIGSREGLFRFDGKYFKSWYANSADSTTFRGNVIHVVDEYVPGKILFISQYTLWQIDIINHKIERVAAFNTVEVIPAPVKINSNCWVVSSRDSVFFTNSKLEKLFGIKVTDYFKPNTFVLAFPLQYPWVILRANNYNQFYFFNYISKKTKPFSIDEKNFKITPTMPWFQAFDSTINRLYLTGWFDVNLYIDIDIAGKSHYTPIPNAALKDGAIMASLLLPQKIMLQGGVHGLYITDFKTTQHYSQHTIPDKPLLSNVISNIYKAPDNKIWLSTDKGISSFSLQPGIIRYWRNEIPLKEDDEFKSIIKGPDSTIYFITSNSGLFKLHTATNTVNPIKTPIVYNWRGLLHNNEIIITGGGKKIAHYNINTGAVTAPGYLNTFYPPGNDLVTLAYKCKKGDFWYSVNFGGGLIHYKAATGAYTQYKPTDNPAAITIRYATTAAEDSKGNMWFGTNKSNTIVKWDAALEKFEEFITNSILPAQKVNNTVNLIYCDSKDNLWIALDGAGIVKYNPYTKKGDYLDLNRGLPTERVNSITTDAQNRIWMGTNKGLSCYLPQTNKVVTFTTSDGLPEDDLRGTGMLFDKKENKIYVGGRRSLACFNPDSLLQSIIQVKPAVYIEDMQVNGKPFYFDDEKNIVLKPGEKNLSFNFAVADFERNNQLEFEYRLKGNSNEWISLDDKRNIAFNDLQNGNYLLSARCKYKGVEQWFETTHPFSITIKTPWQKSLWFRLLIAAIAAFIIWLFIRSYYRRKIEKQKAAFEKQQAIDRERNRMARELHDGLGGMLSGIKHTLTALKNNITLSDEHGAVYDKSVDKLNESIDEIRNLSHQMASEGVLRHGFENTIKDYCNFVSYARKLEIVFEALHTGQMQLTESRAFHLFRIIQEFLQNTIKHAAATRAIVQLNYNNKKLLLTLEDNGKGFDINDAKNKGLGIKNIYERVEMLNAKLNFNTMPGTGTSLIIELHCEEK